MHGPALSCKVDGLSGEGKKNAMGFTQVTYKLQGKRAVVTGASRGTGYDIALALAGAGAEVIAASRSLESLARLRGEIEAAGGTVKTVACDLGSRAAIRKIAAQWGDVDILVNNAALTSVKRESILDQDDETWDQEFAINTVAPVTLMQVLVPGMIRRGGGSVINISSIAAKRPNPLHAAYAASKAALEVVTRAAAIDFGDRNVRVNAVQLGLTDTAALREQLPPGFSLEDMGRMFTPLGRVSRGSEVAALCLLLASDEAAAITGTVITVDGGTTAGTFQPPRWSGG